MKNNIVRFYKSAPQASDVLQRMLKNNDNYGILRISHMLLKDRHYNCIEALVYVYIARAELRLGYYKRALKTIKKALVIAYYMQDEEIYHEILRNYEEMINSRYYNKNSDEEVVFALSVYIC